MELFEYKELKLSKFYSEVGYSFSCMVIQPLH